MKADIARRLATDPDWAPLSVAVFDLTVGGLPVSPYALTAADDGVYVVDSDRRLVARWDETSQSTSIVIAIKDDESLEVPFDVQNRDDMLYVMDTTSLHVLGSDRKTVGHTRFFQSVYGFLSVGQNRFVLNVLDPTGGPELLLVDEQFVPRATFAAAAGPSWGPRGAYGLARLASCPDGIAVAYRHRPLLLRLDLDLRETSAVTVNLPRMDHLLASDRSVRRSPQEKLGWHPTYFGGIACTTSSLFVLIDLPQLRILRYDSTDRQPRVMGADLAGGEYSFERLVASRTPSGYRLYSIVRARDGKTRIAVIRDPTLDAGGGGR